MNEIEKAQQEITEAREKLASSALSHVIDSNPRYRTGANARAAIERLGGEQKVIDMLTRGRVFRFKWCKE